MAHALGQHRFDRQGIISTPEPDQFFPQDQRCPWKLKVDSANMPSVSIDNLNNSDSWD